MKCYVNELNNIGRVYHNNDFFDNTTLYSAFGKFPPAGLK